MRFPNPGAMTISLGVWLSIGIAMDFRPQTVHRIQRTPPSFTASSLPPQQFRRKISAIPSPLSPSTPGPRTIRSDTPAPPAPTPAPAPPPKFFAVGKKSHAKVEAGSKSQPMLIFYPRGEGFAFSCSRVAYTHTPCAYTPKPPRFSAVFGRRVIAIFCQGFGRMASMAQALQLPVEEQLHIATVRDYMVRVRGPNSGPPIGRALSAPGLYQQLLCPPGLPPIAWVSVQVMPRS